MTDVPSPIKIVQDMLATASKVNEAGDMPRVGTFAAKYADQIKDKVNEDNVEAFLQGAAVVNLLIQEAVLRVNMVAAESMRESETDEEKAYVIGTSDGCMAVARLIGEAVDSVMKRAAEQPAMDREFHAIVSTLE